MVLYKTISLNLLLHSVPSFCFQQFLRNTGISAIISTFAQKINPFTRMKKKNPIICFETFVSIHNQKWKVYGDFVLQRHESTPDDNVKKLCEVSQVLWNGEKLLTFPILNLHTMFVFIPVKFSR